MTVPSDSLRILQKNQIYIWKTKIWRNIQLLTAVIIGKLTTALRALLAMNQQQVAIAQRTPDRNPETHANSAHLQTTFLSWKVHTLETVGILKRSFQCIPIDIFGQHDFMIILEAKSFFVVVLDCCGYNYQPFHFIDINKIPKVVVEIKLGSGEGPREDIGSGHGLQTPFTLKDQHTNMWNSEWCL